MRGAQAMAVRGHLAVADGVQGRRHGARAAPGVSRARAASARPSCRTRNIIGLNEHAATLHYQRLRAEAPTVKRSLLIDAGAEFNGYAADITRTYSASATDDFAALIASMDALQQRICGEVKPGVDFVVLHAFTHRQLAGVLRDHKIVTCSADEAVATRHHARFPAARARALARPAGARCRRPARRRGGAQARAAGAGPVSCG